MDKLAVQFIDDLQACEDLAALRHILSDGFAALNFTHFAYHVIRPAHGPRQPLFITNYPWSWSERYIARGYVHSDAVLAASADATGPITWKQVKQSRDLSGEPRRIFDELGEFGIRHGATVSIRGAGGSVAMLTVANNGSEHSFDGLWNDYKYDIQLIAHYVDEAARACHDGPSDQDNRRLTARERECLLWAARGKSAAETALILGVSERTVVFHINNILRKLDVHTKIHAVVKAVMSGLVIP